MAFLGSVGRRQPSLLAPASSLVFVPRLPLSEEEAAAAGSNISPNLCLMCHVSALQ